MTVTGVPMGVVPLRIVKVSVPSSTVPAALVTVALSVTSCGPVTKVAEAEAAAVAVAAALMVKCLAGIGVAEEVGRAVVDRLDDVRAGRGAGGQGIGGAGGAGRDVDGDRRADRRRAVEDREGLGPLVDRARGAGDGRVERDVLRRGAEGRRGCGGGGGAWRRR